jgi:hypothetical protein
MRPCRISTHAQPALMTLAAALSEQPDPGCFDKARYKIALIGFAQDQDRGEHDQHAFEHGREIFSLMMPVGMIVVCRFRAQRGRKQNDDGRHDIDDAFNRIGQQCDAAGQMIGGVFHTEDQQANGNAALRKTANACHLKISLG